MLPLRYLLIYFFLGVITLARILLTPSPEPFLSGEEVTIQTRIIATPQKIGSSVRLNVTLEGREVTLILPQFSKIAYGDVVEVSGKVKTTVLDGGRTVMTIYYPKLTQQKETVSPFVLAGGIRERVRESFRTYLPLNQAVLLQGVVFGISEGMDKDTQTTFQIAGVTHVIAASGMNVTLLAGFLLPLFERIMGRRKSILLTLGVLWLYVVVAGLSASIMRATIMGSLALVGLLVGRQKTALLCLYLTGCMMLIISPSLVSDIGFQLSFMATLGMMLVSPLLPTMKIGKYTAFFAEDLKATLSAQVLTIPILLYYFHTLGLLGLMVNVLVLWTIPYLMIIGSLAAGISLISTSMGGILALLAMPLLWYFLSISSLFASFSPVLSLEELPISLVIGYYLFVSAAILLASKLITQRRKVIPVTTEKESEV